MSIGRVADFGILISNTLDEIKEYFANKDVKNIELKNLIKKHGGMVYNKVTNVFNFIFSYKNCEYNPVTEDWIRDNLSLRHLKMLILEVADQNQLDWLPPLFLDFFQNFLNSMKKAMPAIIKSTVTMKK